MAKEQVSRMVALLEAELAERAPADAPKLRAIAPADFPPEFQCASEREWLCDQVRFLARVYSLDWFVRQESRGYAGLESMTDEDLQCVYRRVSHAIQCIKDGISFEDAGLIRDANEL